MQKQHLLAGATLVALLLLVGLAVTWTGNGGGEDLVRADSASVPAALALQVETLEIATAGGIKTFQVEVARSSEQQAKGLMFRTALADDRGMLFPHKEPRELSMWMRNTYIPLDMVFINADGTIHRIEHQTEPLSEKVIGSNGDVSAVLELAGGASERLGIKPGDKVRHSVFTHR